MSIRMMPQAVVTALLVALVAFGAPTSVHAASTPSSSDVSTRDAAVAAHERRPAADDLAEVAAAARQDGTARTLVRLPVPVEADGDLTPGESAAQRAAIAERGRALRADLHGVGAEVVQTYETVPVIALELPEAAVDALARSPHVADVAVDVAFEPTLAESTELIEADLLWSLGLEGLGRSVAVLDTGVDTSHSFLGGRVVAEACFSTDTSDDRSSSTSLCPGGGDMEIGAGTAAPCDIDGAECGHGTHVAGIAAGAGLTRSGVAPAAGIVAVQVFQDGGNGLSASMSDLLAAMEWVYEQRDEHDLAAVNLSLGEGSYDRACDGHMLAPIIDNLSSAGVATVVATGNAKAHDAVSAPACVSGAIAVGASTKHGEVADFSNAHPDLLDLLAPGTSISSSVPGGGFASASGTSMSAPHVAGAWALLQDADAPRAPVDDVLQALASTGQPLTDTRHIDRPTYPEIRLEAAHDAFVASSADTETGDTDTSDGGDTETGTGDTEDSETVAPEPGTVSGTVTDTSDGGALEGVDVAVDGATGTVTGVDGTYAVEGLTAGSYTVSATLDGYESASAEVDVAEGETVTVDLALAPVEIFSDVSSDHVFFEEISWMAESGVTSGYADGTFRPTADVTRQAMAAFLFKVAGEPSGPFPDPGFSDVSSDHVFFEEISWMAESGVTSGYADGTFRPTADVTRQAMAAFLYKHVH